jgi:two-component system, cell cycle response regulator DivK
VLAGTIQELVLTCRPVGVHMAAEKKPKILIVEDSPEIQVLEQELFGRVGATVMTVGTGEAAVDAVRQSLQRKDTFDLVVLDIKLPTMSGFEAARQIRAHGFRGLIAVFTAHATMEGKEEGRASGVDLYFTKDVLRSPPRELPAAGLLIVSRPEMCLHILGWDSNKCRQLSCSVSFCPTMDVDLYSSHAWFVVSTPYSGFFVG